MPTELFSRSIRFLQDGFHEIDDIYEVPPGTAVPTDVAHPAGPN